MYSVRSRVRKFLDGIKAVLLGIVILGAIVIAPFLWLLLIFGGISFIAYLLMQANRELKKND